MNKHRPYNNIIERKLEQLSATDTDLLWNDMHAILDKRMPQKKERRRFITWFLSTKGFLLINFIFLAVICSTFYFLTTKENSRDTLHQVNHSAQSNNTIENGEAKNSHKTTESISPINRPANKQESFTFTAPSSVNESDDKISNGTITFQPRKQSQKYRLEEQFNEPTEEISMATVDLDATMVDARSVDQNFIVSTQRNDEKDSSNTQPQPAANSKKKGPGNNKESGFYAGIISGVDLSSIRFRSVRTGASKGFIIGYALNKKWSIESGLHWDTKRIYDDGAYFNPPGYTPSSGITITAVNGKSRLYELPVNMKYTMITGKHSLFATAGLSSYFMRLENYDYEYSQNSQPGGHNYLSYKNETKNWFSVINFSTGYTHKFGNTGSLRIEPYLKIPIKNIGVGNMPIMSTGLNIGFTKPIR